MSYANSHDKRATDQYAAGKIQLWELRLREFNDRHMRHTGKPASRQQMDDRLAEVCHMYEWVDDPTFGKPQMFSPEQINSIRDSLKSLPQLRRQFEQFIAKQNDSETLRIGGELF